MWDCGGAVHQTSRSTGADRVIRVGGERSESPHAPIGLDDESLSSLCVCACCGRVAWYRVVGCGVWRHCCVQWEGGGRANEAIAIDRPGWSVVHGAGRVQQATDPCAGCWNSHDAFRPLWTHQVTTPCGL